MKKVICVVGPTAIGKSSLSIEIAKKFNGEVINGDSISVYRELNIGSAKTTIEEMQGIKHHLIDYKDVGEDYNVMLFQKDGREAIEQIISQEKLPVVAGGTGLYIKALLYDYSFIENQENEEDNYEEYDNYQLFDMLKSLDEKATFNIHPNNRKRVIRALNMAKSGNLKSEQEENQKHEMIYDALIIGLTIDRETLHKRIDQRVNLMFQQGLVEEVTELFKKYPIHAKGLDGIGYKEFVPYFENLKTLDEIKEDIKTHTRQFAKRQYTWFNHQMDVKWYDISEADYKEKIMKDIEDFSDR